MDLGYSSVTVGDRRVCLIDCPGHAALIRAVVAAASVIDAAVIVVSAVRGVEAQTAEHLLLASLCLGRRKEKKEEGQEETARITHPYLVILTKVDIATPEQITAAEKAVKRAFKTLGLGDSPKIVKANLQSPSVELIGEMKREIGDMLAQACLHRPSTSSASSSSFTVAVDHCFTLKGKGSVLTGSVLDETVRTGAEVELPHLGEKRKVKELQSWKQKRDEVSCGERVAMMVGPLASPVSRCLVGSPGSLHSISQVRASVNMVPFFRHTIKDGAKVHVSCGYETEIATVRIGRMEKEEEGVNRDTPLELLPTLTPPCVAFITFAKPIFSPIGSFYVASRLELQAKGCRFAFHGELLEVVSRPPRFFSRQRREGEVERVHDSRTLIVKNLFKKETKQSLFTNIPVLLSTGEEGRLEDPFGSSGKTKVLLKQAISDATKSAATAGSVKVRLYLRKFLDDRTLEGYVPTPEELEKEGEGVIGLNDCR